MFRFLFSFVFTVVSARWIYSEIQLTVPHVIPILDYALERVQIPTHDKWDREKINAFLGSLENNVAALVGDQNKAVEGSGTRVAKAASQYKL